MANSELLLLAMCVSTACRQRQHLSVDGAHLTALFSMAPLLAACPEWPPSGGKKGPLLPALSLSYLQQQLRDLPSVERAPLPPMVSANGPARVIIEEGLAWHRDGSLSY